MEKSRCRRTGFPIHASISLQEANEDTGGSRHGRGSARRRLVSDAIVVITDAAS